MPQERENDSQEVHSTWKAPTTEAGDLSNLDQEKGEVFGQFIDQEAAALHEAVGSIAKKSSDRGLVQKLRRLGYGLSMLSALAYGSSSERALAQSADDKFFEGKVDSISQVWKNELATESKTKFDQALKKVDEKFTLTKAFNGIGHGWRTVYESEKVDDKEVLSADSKIATVNEKQSLVEEFNRPGGKVIGYRKSVLYSGEVGSNFYHGTTKEKLTISGSSDSLGVRESFGEMKMWNFKGSGDGLGSSPDDAVRHALLNLMEKPYPEHRGDIIGPTGEWGSQAGPEVIQTKERGKLLNLAVMGGEVATTKSNCKVEQREEGLWYAVVTLGGQ